MITLNEALGDAQRKRIAIGHFNVSDLVALKAVTGAARELKVPVLIGTSEGERDFIGVREIVAVVASLREEFDQPIFVNADHTHSLERAVAAAKAGYDMIGFDVSTMPLEKNIALTRQAVEAVKSINPQIIIEGELGFIGSGSEIHEIVPESSHLLTKTDDAKRFVEATQIDVLAPAVGNMHGLLKSMISGSVRKPSTSAGSASSRRRRAYLLPSTEDRERMTATFKEQYRPAYRSSISAPSCALPGVMVSRRHWPRIPTKLFPTKSTANPFRPWQRSPASACACSMRGEVAPRPNRCRPWRVP
jgi:hypothetical protein